MRKTTLAVVLSTSLLAFDFGSIIDTATKTLAEPTPATSIKAPITTATSLSSSTVTNGLKAALKSGVDFGVKELSKNGGYLNNASVKIPLPENLSKMESIIRGAGGDKIADDLINSMNSAATEAAPKTAKIFLDSIDKMSIDDAKQILAGKDDAATEYFKTHTTKDLKNMIKPIIEKTMTQNSVASYYDTFNETYNTYGKGLVQSSGIMDMAKGYGVDGFIPESSDINLNDYVTTKAIDGLFKMIATKEGEIRKNPVAQTTSLLKQVFGN